MDLHPHIAVRKVTGPPKHKQAAGSGFNSWLALKITSGVGTMWCAYVFALIALVSLPDAIHGGRPTIISWVAQTFVQLVLLSIIMVGQNISAAASDTRSLATFDDATAILHTALQIEDHLAAQDKLLEQSLAATGHALDSFPVPPPVPVDALPGTPPTDFDG
jgi:hypothetical protein